MKDIDLLSLILQAPGASPPIVWGSPGIGKTDRMRQLAAKLNWRLEVLPVGELGEGFFGVVPVPVVRKTADGEDYVLRFPPVELIQQFEDDPRPGLLFLDDLSVAPPALHGALMGLILNGRLGDRQFPARVRRAAAANDLEQTTGWQFPDALENRMTQLVWSAPTPQVWAEDWLALQPAETPGIQRVKACFTQLCRNPATLSGVLGGRPLWEVPKDYAGRRPLAFCSPRSLASGMRLIASAFDAGNEDAALPLFVASIGEPRALPILSWLRKNDLPNVEEILAKPESWEPSKNEPDKVFAVCQMISDFVCAAYKSNGKPSKAEHKAAKAKADNLWHAAWLALERAIPVGKDIVVIAGRRLAAPGNMPESGLIDPRVKPIIGQLAAVVSASI